MNGFEIYKKMDDDVQAIYRSRLLTEILLSLSEGSRKLSQSSPEIQMNAFQIICSEIKKE